MKQILQDHSFPATHAASRPPDYGRSWDQSGSLRVCSPHLCVQGMQEPVLQLLWHLVIAQCPRRTDRFFVRLQEGYTIITTRQMPLQYQGGGRIKCATDIVQQQGCGLFTRDPAWYRLRHAPLVLPLRG